MKNEMKIENIAFVVLNTLGSFMGDHRSQVGNHWYRSWEWVIGKRWRSSFKGTCRVSSSLNSKCNFTPLHFWLVMSPFLCSYLFLHSGVRWKEAMRHRVNTAKKALDLPANRSIIFYHRIVEFFCLVKMDKAATHWMVIFFANYATASEFNESLQAPSQNPQLNYNRIW